MKLCRSFKIRENELDFVKKNARTRNDWEIVNKFIRSWCYSLRFAARVVGAAQTRTCRCKLVACGQLTQVRIYGFGAMSRGLHRPTSASGTSWRKNTLLKKYLKSKMYFKMAEVFKLNININTARCWILDTNYWPNIQQKGWSLRFRVSCCLSLILNHES